jgi:hypothetical protein
MLLKPLQPLMQAAALKATVVRNVQSPATVPFENEAFKGVFTARSGAPVISQAPGRWKKVWRVMPSV